MGVKRKQFYSRLPAVSCTPEMREAVIKKATEFDCNMVELQRAALQFFLTSDVNKVDIFGQEYEHQSNGETGGVALNEG
jgi:hypothetical protein